MVSLIKSRPPGGSRQIQREHSRVGAKLRTWLRALRWSVQSIPEKRVLWIFGCQRSGTSVLCSALGEDPRSILLWEDSRLTGKRDQRLRLLPFGELGRRLERVHRPLIVVKPLVESQHAAELLGRFDDSCGVWMYRNFLDVVNSLIRRHPNQIRNVQEMIEPQQANWRCERLSETTRQILQQYFDPQMSQTDAAALFWIARNRLFFEQQLDRQPRVRLVAYETFVQQTNEELAEIYQLIGLEPCERGSADVDERSLSLGRDVKLAPGIHELCERLHARLEETRLKQIEDSSWADRAADQSPSKPEFRLSGEVR